MNRPHDNILYFYMQCWLQICVTTHKVQLIYIIRLCEYRSMYTMTMTKSLHIQTSNKSHQWWHTDAQKKIYLQSLCRFPLTCSIFCSSIGFILFHFRKIRNKLASKNRNDKSYRETAMYNIHALLLLLLLFYSVVQPHTHSIIIMVVEHFR